MINQFEVPACIEDTIPALKEELHQFPAVHHINETMGCFTKYTDKQLRAQNFSSAGKCLQLAGRLYERGNTVVKEAITRIFLPGTLPGSPGRCREQDPDVFTDTGLNLSTLHTISTYW
ncbi:hypothetical protein QFZ51_000579 [Chitinophaga sp. W3I9]|uniref:DUF7674 family protein n=1 Tax=Chitinophaga sp. W3I9 TaxID=3373924 RepID=UPI003D216C01